MLNDDFQLQYICDCWLTSFISFLNRQIRRESNYDCEPKTVTKIIKYIPTYSFLETNVSGRKLTEEMFYLLLLGYIKGMQQRAAVPRSFFCPVFTASTIYFRSDCCANYVQSCYKFSHCFYYYCMHN